MWSEEKNVATSSLRICAFIETNLSVCLKQRAAASTVRRKRGSALWVMEPNMVDQLQPTADVQTGGKGALTPPAVPCVVRWKCPPPSGLSVHGRCQAGPEALGLEA